VERLINEGAVRTVKKPIQMKRRLVTTQPQVFYHKENFEGMGEQVDDKESSVFNAIDNERNVAQEENCTIEQNHQAHQTFDSVEISSTSNDLIYDTTDTQSDMTYLMMDDNSSNICIYYFLYINV